MCRRAPPSVDAPVAVIAEAPRSAEGAFAVRPIVTLLDGWRVDGTPLELVRDGGRTMLVLEEAGGEPLDRLVGPPVEVDASCALSCTSQPGVLNCHCGKAGRLT